MGQEEWLFIGPGEGSFQSEVLSLPLGSATCGLAIDPLPEFIEREGAVAALLGGLVTVCNTVDGWFNVTQDIGHRTHCFSLDPVLGTWAESIEPLLWHAMPPTCFPCFKYWQKTMRHCLNWSVKLT